MSRSGEFQMSTVTDTDVAHPVTSSWRSTGAVRSHFEVRQCNPVTCGASDLLRALPGSFLVQPKASWYDVSGVIAGDVAWTDGAVRHGDGPLGPGDARYTAAVGITASISPQAAALPVHLAEDPGPATARANAASLRIAGATFASSVASP